MIAKQCHKRWFRFSRWLVLTLVCVLVSGCAALITPNFSTTIEELRPGDYALDKEHAYILFRIEHLGLSTVVGRFNASDASLQFNPDRLDELDLTGFVDTGSIDLNNRDLERRLRGREWLDTERFPQALFDTQSVSDVSGNTFTINGQFTLKGETRPLSLQATFKGGADNLLTGKYTLGFAAEGSFLRSEFGIDSLGGLVADEVFIEIHAEFQKQG